MVTSASFLPHRDTTSTLPETQFSGEERFAQLSEYITGVFVYPAISLLGLLLNTFCLIVFHRQGMRTTTNCFLAALAVSDNCKLLNDFVYFPTVLLKGRHVTLLYSLYYPYGYFFSQYFSSVTAWLTVAVAVERYFLVVHPTCRGMRISLRHARLQCCLIYGVLLCISAPCALRYRTTTPTEGEDAHFDAIVSQDLVESVKRANSTGEKRQEWRVERGHLWDSAQFRHVYVSVYSLLRSVLPFFTLLYISTRVILVLHRKRATTAKRFVARHRITVMLVVVILTFLCLSMPDALLSMMDWGYHEIDSPLKKGIREIADALLCLNSAINFFPYLAFNVRFRLQARLLCGWMLRSSSMMTLRNGDPSTVRGERGVLMRRHYPLGLDEAHRSQLLNSLLIDYLIFNTSRTAGTVAPSNHRINSWTPRRMSCFVTSSPSPLYGQSAAATRSHSRQGLLMRERLVHDHTHRLSASTCFR